MPKSCFVIQRIASTGSKEHRHFRAVFEQVAPVIRQHGYQVVRADDLQTSGAITKDVVRRLGEADLVVADLTGLNANVMYELGVRHTLRGQGTILILDTTKTSDIPFDLSSYRVIKFEGRFLHIAGLTQKLDEFICELEQRKGFDFRDSPVHDWFPTLPSDVVRETSKSPTAGLRKNIRRLSARLSLYEKAYGTGIWEGQDSVSAFSRISAALSNAEAGTLPKDLVMTARRAAVEQNAVGFLRAVRTIVERNLRIGVNNFGILADLAKDLALDDAQKAILDQAVAVYPRERAFVVRRMQKLAHSDDPLDVRRAIVVISEFLKLTYDKGVVDLKGVSIKEEDLPMIGVMLDAYHRAHRDSEALNIARHVLDLYPNNPTANRNYAKFLEKRGHAGDAKDAMRFYRAAILTENADDQSAIWLGNALHNRRRIKEAAEAYALGCVLDPSDRANFCHLLEELAQGNLKHTALGAELGGDEFRADIYSMENINMAYFCASACPTSGSTEGAAHMLHGIRESMEIELSEPEGGLRRPQRLEYARRMYALLKTALTTRGEDYEFEFIEDNVGSGAFAGSGKVS